ncbi:TetR/AcrR family transcriptional regulator [Streptomyces sp. NPDC002643]
MKTRPYHHGDLRAALLTLAERTLREKGPGALSLRELAREAGVSPAAPSRHFKGKQALLDALALAGLGRLASELATALEQAGDSFADRLTAFARAYVGFATANAALLDLMYAVRPDPVTPRELVVAKQRLSAMAADVIRDGQRRGEVREGAVDRLAVPVSAALQGLVALAASGCIAADGIEQGVDDTIAAILRGYAP